MAELERDVEAYFVLWIRNLRGATFKLRFIGVAGAPDRIVFMPGGRIYLVELKRPRGGVVSGLQEKLHGLLARLGSPVPVLYTHAAVDDWCSKLGA